MRKMHRSFVAAAGAALVVSLLCAAVGAQEPGAGAPAPATAGEVKAPAAAATPVGIPGIPGKGSAVKEGRRPVGWLGCTRACPNCLRSCELNPGHYGNHMCSEGHQF